MPEEVQLIVLDLTSKVGALSHPVCNGNACTEAGAFGCFCVPVVCTKLDILRYSNEV